MNKLKPCPFCGNYPKLFGKKIREIDGETMDVMPERTEWCVVPFCKITCVLGHAFSTAYGIHGDGGYETPEAAIRAWNKRYAVRLLKEQEPKPQRYKEHDPFHLPFCPNEDCNAVMKSYWKFCPYCGAPMAWDEELDERERAVIKK